LNYVGNDMSPDHSQNDILANLRWMAASDPKQARTAFHAILQGQEEVLNNVLTAASRPGDGRLRQMIATVFKTDEKATILESWLRRWLEVEPDEFTKNAIESALASRAPAPAPRPASRNPTVQTVEAYRYVADRLCHRIRNALTLPNSQLIRLQYLVGDIGDPSLKQELMEILTGFQTGLLRISRNVEFDTGDDYLSWQTIPVVGWLESASIEFEARFGPAKLVIICDPAVRRVKIRATRFSLETVFGNLWSNAIQAVEPPCRFEVQCALDTGRGVIDMLVLDNGPGFAETHLETAFQQVFSTKADSRGRGLLEIADAVLRLQGTVELARASTGEYRIRISLPVEAV
jgi:signal transduction histidine kinase